MDKDKLTTITFYLPANIKKEFQLAVIQNNTDMTTVLVESVNKYLIQEQ